MTKVLLEKGYGVALSEIHNLKMASDCAMLTILITIPSQNSTQAYLLTTALLTFVTFHGPTNKVQFNG